MVHSVNVMQLNENGEYMRVTSTHEFAFEVSARKWVDGFNRVHSELSTDDDNYLAVYVGEQTTEK